MSDDERPTAAGLSVGRLLGAGGSSSVWLVEDRDGQRFALKVLRVPREDGVAVHGVPSEDGATRRGRRAARTDSLYPGGPTAPDRPERTLGDVGGASSADRSAASAVMWRELRLLLRFSHDHLLRVHRIVETDLGPGMLMDFAPGGSLLGLLTSRGPLPVAEVVTALVPIAQALGYLHDQGALHGDVTPGNILFASDGRPLLGDFGTGRLLGGDRPSSGGTPGFLDPAHPGSFDPGVDVFALSAVAWFALTGRIPGPTDERPPLSLMVPEVPVQLMRLIEDGLSSDRDRRPSAGDFARTLMRAATPIPVDLVPAVHASVLPELLTRRAGPDPAPTAAGLPGLAGRSRARRTPARAPGRARQRPGEAPAGRRVRRGSSPARRQRGRRPGLSRGLPALLGGGVALLLLIAGLTLAIGGRGAPATLPTDAGADHGVDQGTPGPEHAIQEQNDPLTALSRLVAARAAAFAAADPALLADVDVEGSPAMSADTEAVEALAEAGRKLAGLSITIHGAAVLSDEDQEFVPALGELPAAATAPATQVRLVRATAVLSSYTTVRTVDPGRSANASVPSAASDPTIAQGQQQLIFVLWNSGAGWRIHSVLSPPQ
ncbi:serine/threonine protein kinase [Arthrobacter echini]|uniref:non-specific serine/threonine protein kinase n=1 Tax=Arthrobacter echini TaxID=1529066 RepID=A0A4S5E7Q4_9MICC|nr:serine/threonine-protein kinase [Arthrobacter echini]THJ67522.1 serine/threonine protein kinase [Arthrobacter echini]